jgi:protein-disulfide isomerase
VILTQLKPVGDITIPEREKATQTSELTMGSPDAKVKVTEFADFQCPACGAYWTSLEPKIISEYVNTGKVSFTFSPFSFLGNYAKDKTWDESVKAAEAAFCANDQGKFWEYRDILFANQNGENAGAFTRERLLAFGKKIGLNSSKFRTCLDSDKYKVKITEANDFASAQGVTYTPSFIVNGKLVNKGELIPAIEAALK